MIEVKNISKTYSPKMNPVRALQNINLTIGDGQKVAIIGKSGSGKSTLMHIMSGLDSADSGEVIIEGKNILAFKQKESDKFRAREMSFIFQSFFVDAQETCEVNVSLPLEILRTPKRQRPELIKRALSAVELLEKKDSKASELSGGQRQRLAIARAIVHNPKVLFADEPTGNLDSETGNHVMNTLFNLCKLNNTTLIIVTHDFELARQCDVIVYIRDGVIEKIQIGKEVENA
jgi:putative ABC transport system ATP-binding protein